MLFNYCLNKRKEMNFIARDVSNCTEKMKNDLLNFSTFLQHVDQRQTSYNTIRFSLRSQKRFRQLQLPLTAFDEISSASVTNRKYQRSIISTASRRVSRSFSTVYTSLNLNFPRASIIITYI